MSDGAVTRRLPVSYAWRGKVTDAELVALTEAQGGRLAAAHAKESGCEWLEVDFDDASGLVAFYFDACGFRPTNAGLLHLPELPDSV